MKKKLISLIARSVGACAGKGLLPDVDLSRIEVEVPANPEHGDYASNIAMVLASQARQNPRKIAQAIQENLDDPEGIVEKTQIAGPGFLNFMLKDDVWRSVLKDILDQKDRYGCLPAGSGKKVQVEFVSANPTGPLHIGHARGAVVGDVLCNLLAATGQQVSREYYINDAGNQMNNLGRSVLYRLRELAGEAVEFPENGYRG
ncbi:MAG: arginine--tRNA ligase, partial [Smithellaceae bacterium]